MYYMYTHTLRALTPQVVYSTTPHFSAVVKLVVYYFTIVYTYTQYTALSETNVTG